MQVSSDFGLGKTAIKSRVLVVDDEPQVLIALEDLLSEDYQVLTAHSPLAALRMLADQKDVAVVISDQRMPGMNGDELLSLLADTSDATRVMVTGYAELGAVIRAVNAGRIFAYVTKPWNGDELQLTVRKCVEHFDLVRRLARERQLLDDLMSNVPEAIYFKGSDLRFEKINQSLASRIELADVSEAIGKRLSELGVPAELAAEIESAEASVVAEGRAKTNLLSVVERADGRRFYSTTIAPVRANGGTVQGLVGISRDVTEREETERALRRLTHVRTMLGAVNGAIARLQERDELVRESCRIAVDAGGLAASAILLLDRERAMVTTAVSHGAVGLASQFVGAWTGYDPDDPWNRTTLVRTGKPVVINHVHASDERAWIADIAQRGGESVGLFPLVRDERTIGVFLLVSSQAQFFDAEEVRLLAEVADNIAFALDHIERRALVDFLAYYDELTNLPKRQLLLDRLHQLLPARTIQQKLLALVLVDVSRLRQINETLGRAGGDELLVQMSRRLTALLAEGDTLARFDGDAFAFLLASPGDERAVGAWIETTLLGAMNAPMTVRDTEVRVSVRIGVALFPGDAVDAEGLVRNAEAALSNARAAGHRYAFYESSMNARAGEKFTLETRLRRALENDEFLLHYQPKVDMRTGNVVGLEALIRWLDPERGLVSPAAFIPLLEETGMIIEVGAWVLERAAAQYVDWLSETPSPPRIAVNVSAIQLSESTFVRSVSDVLARYPLASDGLDIELTESVLMGDLGGTVLKLRALKELGVHIAIDDFGTGYSSLGYLSRLPIDALKIDRSFVMRMSEDPQDMTIVTTIISLAHSLDLCVIAEGVETKDQARLLRLVKCDQIQGYLVGKPRAAAELPGEFGPTKRTWPPRGV
jgi:diguanylate cyclase (GGDEF)-like protein/PAS domain S-box-containing protein